MSRVNAKILTTPVKWSCGISRGRHEYLEYFEDRAKAPLRAKFELDTGIGQKGAFSKGLWRNTRRRYAKIKKDRFDFNLFGVRWKY